MYIYMIYLYMYTCVHIYVYIYIYIYICRCTYRYILTSILSGLNACTSHHQAPLRRTRQAGAQPTAGPAWDTSCHVCVTSHDAYVVFPNGGDDSWDSAERSRNRKHSKN